MKNCSRFLPLFFFLALMNVANGQDGESRHPSSQKKAVVMEQSHALYRSSKIIGAPIQDRKNSRIGKIQDLVLDSDRGEIAYVVVSFGGILNVRDKYHALPWRALEAGEYGKYYLLDADRETLVNAPGFNRWNWPDMADKTWAREVEGYWGRMIGHGASGGISTNSGANSASGSNCDCPPP